MKKLVALVSALCLGFVFTVGCGGTPAPKKTETKPGAEKKTDVKAPPAPEKKDEKK
jgi:hypothetical protein